MKFWKADFYKIRDSSSLSLLQNDKQTLPRHAELVKASRFTIFSVSSLKHERGFTLIEIIMAMVLIGIAVPTIMIPFSGLSDTKTPEYTVQASFIAQKKLEELASQSRTTIDSQIAATCNNTSDGPGNAYTLTCASIDVNATDPDTSDGGASSFAKKITLTVSRADGAMTPLVFNTLFTLD